MKQKKIYNIIFPFWLITLLPPVLFIMLIGNFIIDSLVVLGCFYGYKLGNKYINIKTFYLRTIIMVWIFGFFSDIIGAAILLLLTSIEGYFHVNNDIINAVNYDPFSNLFAVIIILLCMMISSTFIFLFNYLITFKYIVDDKKLRFKVALTISLVTMPWTFLIPTKWFY